jgi:hypothetical protein
MAEQMDERIRRICGHRKVVFSAIASQKKTFHWYSNWKNEEFTCVDRSWQGLGHETFPDEVGMMECPQCDHGVAYLVFPNLTETDEAAAAGNQEAIQVRSQIQVVDPTEDSLDWLTGDHFSKLRELTYS